MSVEIKKYQNTLFHRKEAIIKYLNDKFSNDLKVLAKSDESHTGPFYQIIENIKGKFIDTIDNKEIPELKDNLFYAIIICEDGLELRIVKLENVYEENGKICEYYNDQFSLIKTKCKTLNIVEFSKRLNVSEAVVLQKIRRGLIPIASKVSNYWYIPETVLYSNLDNEVRTYKWDIDESEFIEEEKLYKNYKNFKNYNMVQITKKNKNKLKKGEHGKFIVTFSKLNSGKVKILNDLEEELTTTEKERLESMLIANSYVRYENNEIFYISNVNSINI